MLVQRNRLIIGYCYELMMGQVTDHKLWSITVVFFRVVVASFLGIFVPRLV